MGRITRTPKPLSRSSILLAAALALAGCSQSSTASPPPTSGTPGSVSVAPTTAEEPLPPLPDQPPTAQIFVDTQGAGAKTWPASTFSGNPKHVTVTITCLPAKAAFTVTWNGERVFWGNCSPIGSTFGGGFATGGAMKPLAVQVDKGTRWRIRITDEP